MSRIKGTKSDSSSTSSEAVLEAQKEHLNLRKSANLGFQRLKAMEEPYLTRDLEERFASNVITEWLKM